MCGRYHGLYVGGERIFEKSWMESKRCVKCHEMILMREGEKYCSKCQKVIGYGPDNKSGLSTRESEDETAKG